MLAFQSYSTPWNLTLNAIPGDSLSAKISLPSYTQRQRRVGSKAKAISMPSTRLPGQGRRMNPPSEIFKIVLVCTWGRGVSATRLVLMNDASFTGFGPSPSPSSWADADGLDGSASQQLFPLIRGCSLLEIHAEGEGFVDELEGGLRGDRSDHYNLRWGFPLPF